MHQFHVYLAGPIDGLSYDAATDWRQQFGEKLHFNIVPLSPMRYKRFLESYTNINDKAPSLENHPLSSAKGITTRDRNDVLRADMVVFNFAGAKKGSLGSCVEVGWADAWRKPCVAVMTPDDIHWHSIIRECMGFIVPTLEQAADIINATLNTDRPGFHSHGSTRSRPSITFGSGPQDFSSAIPLSN